MGRPIPVIPGTLYAGVVGAKGLGSLHGVYPTLAGPSTFGGFKVLGANTWSIECVFGVNPGCTFGNSNSGAGGGSGGGRGISNGGGNRLYALLEASHYSGGAGGASYPPGTTTGNGQPGENTVSETVGVLGGPRPNWGLQAAVGSGVGGVTPYGGSPGAGTLFGGTNGANGGGIDPVLLRASANPTHYGAGAGGTGEPSNSQDVKGGDGAGGCIMLMWSE